MVVERVSPTDSSLQVTITPPSSSYDEFTVTYGPTEGSEMISITVSDVSSPITITGLDPYTEYTFNVTTLFMEFPSTVVSETMYTGTCILVMLDMIQYPVYEINTNTECFEVTLTLDNTWKHCLVS